MTLPRKPPRNRLLPAASAFTSVVGVIRRTGARTRAIRHSERNYRTSLFDRRRRQSRNSQSHSSPCSRQRITGRHCEPSLTRRAHNKGIEGRQTLALPRVVSLREGLYAFWTVRYTHELWIKRF